MGRVEFRLPDVGEGIDAAELVEWKVSVGDEVAEDQPLADVETDKATVEIPCPATGRIGELRYEPGQRIDVGAVMVVITTDVAAERAPTGGLVGSDDGGPPATAAAAPGPAPDSAKGERPSPRPGRAGRPASDPPGRKGRPLASPATRRFARDSGVDLTSVVGSGRGGRIEREDVEAALGTRPATDQAERRPAVSRGTPDGPTVVPLSGIRRTIAHRLTDAWQQVPKVTDYREVDATRLLQVRASVRNAAGARGDERLARALTLVPFIVKIACRALIEHPYVNSSIDLDADTITLHPQCNIALATATPDGLMVPVIHGAEELSVAEIAIAATELNEAAQQRRLRPEQLAAGTFTVNNFGGLGIWLGTPIVVPPQVANLGIGRLEERPVVVDGQVVVRPIIPLSVSGDHRVLDGHTLAAFVSRIIELMADPALLLEESR